MKSRKHIKVNANNIVDNVKENNDSYNIDYDMFTTCLLYTSDAADEL